MLLLPLYLNQRVFSSQLANTGGPWLVILHEQHECRTCNLWEFVKEFVKFKTSIVSIYEY